MNYNTTESVHRRKDRAKIAIKGAWTAIPNKLLLDTRLSRDARLLGCLMFMHAANSGRAFPSQEELAAELGSTTRTVTTDPETNEKRVTCTERQTTVRSVQRWLIELRDAGWLRWRQTLRNNEYTLLDPTESECESPPRANHDTDAAANQTMRVPSCTDGQGCGDDHNTDAAANRTDIRAETVSSQITNEAHPDTPVEPKGATAVSSSTMIKVDSCNVDSSSSEPRADDDDEVISYLMECGVLAAGEFRGLDPAAVRDRVERLMRDPNCRPGAIVKSLRKYPPKPAARVQSGGSAWARYTSGAYGDLFRLGSDTSDLEPVN